jgi:hypothetical protein
MSAAFAGESAVAQSSSAAATSRAARTWGDNSVMSSCRSYSRAKGPGTSAGA